MNKKIVYQVGNNKKVILWCTANQISRWSQSVAWKVKQTFHFVQQSKQSSWNLLHILKLC